MEVFFLKEKNDIDVINKSLEKLISNGYITKSDAEILKLFYYEDKRNIEDINDEIAKFPINKSFLKEKLKGAKIDKEKKKVENTTPSLSLENIVDFEKDGKSFIKIHYPFPDDRVRVIENRTDPFKTAKEIFEELNESIGFKPICNSVWPKYDSKKVEDTQKTIGVQVNGKLRGTIEVNITDSKEVVEAKAKELENVQNFINGKEIVKIIIVPNKIVNIVVK